MQSQIQGENHMNNAKVFAKLFPTGWIARTFSILWTLICVSVLTYALLHGNDSAKGYENARMREQIWMILLSFPVCVIAAFPLYLIIAILKWMNWSYKTTQMISIEWLIFFSFGYFQWFIFPRLCVWLVDKLSNYAPFDFTWIRRKLGIRDAGNISCIPKDRYIQTKSKMPFS
jgi:hypothetical protein